MSIKRSLVNGYLTWIGATAFAMQLVGARGCGVDLGNDNGGGDVQDAALASDIGLVGHVDGSHDASADSDLALADATRSVDAAATIDAQIADGESTQPDSDSSAGDASVGTGWNEAGTAPLVSALALVPDEPYGGRILDVVGHVWQWVPNSTNGTICDNTLVPVPTLPSTLAVGLTASQSVIMVDGTVWGDTPVFTADGTLLDGVTDALGNSSSGCARRVDGTVWCWGVSCNDYLADGDTTPCDPTGGPATDVRSFAAPTDSAIQGVSWLGVAASGGRCVAEGANFDFVCWAGAFDETALDPLQPELTPTSVGFSAEMMTRFQDNAVPSGPAQIGYCRLMAGAVQCIGANSRGASGTGASSPIPVTVFTPVVTSVQAPLSGIVSIASTSEPGDIATGPTTGTNGASYTCALAEDGGVWCWGSNTLGQLGDGTTTDRPYAVQVLGLPAPATQLSLSTGRSCAVLTDHSAWCWGLADGADQPCGHHTTHLTAAPLVFDPPADAGM